MPPSDKLAAEHGDEEERLARERQLAALKRGDAAPDPKTFRDGDLGESRAKAAKAQAQPRGEDGTFGTGCDSEESPTVHLPHAVAARVLAEDPLDFPGRGA